MRILFIRSASLAALAAALSACAIMPASGPSTRGVVHAAGDQTVGEGRIKLIDVNDDITRAILADRPQPLFSDALGEGQRIGAVIGRGDVLDISIWEAPPAALFGAAGGDTSLGAASGSLARGTPLPEQMVDSDGLITIPFAGRIQADGRTPQQIASAIVSRLARKAHQPQAIVRLTRNSAANVTVIGDVASSARVPLTSRGERILDILASAGGTKHPIDKTTIQVTREDTNVSMPMAMVISDPRQNVRLRPDDVLTVLFQPFSFTALGAAGQNAEVPFEATGLTLAQALGRISGLQDARADAKGVFIFRMESAGVLNSADRVPGRTGPNAKIPVIYRVNLKDPATFFVAQSFPIRNGDVLYVSNAPLADIQKFVNVIYSTFLPATTTATAF